jgi:hypothetical protein
VVAVRPSLHIKLLVFFSFVMHQMTKSSCDKAKKHAAPVHGDSVRHKYTDS